MLGISPSDNHDAGRDGARKIAELLALNPRVAVAIATIPGLPARGDVTDFFVEQGRTVEELRGILADAVPFVEAPVAERGDPTPVPLEHVLAAELGLG